MVKVQRTPASPVANRRMQDICGLLLFFIGAATLLCLSWRQDAPIPDIVDTGLRLLAGLGAYGIPLLLMFAGTMFLIGYERLSLSHSSYGTLLLFLVYVTWLHLLHVPNAIHWVSADVVQAGGWLGGLFGTALISLLGQAISHLTLILLTLISLVLIVDQPLIEIARRIREHGRSGAQAVRSIGANISERQPSGNDAPQPDSSSYGQAVVRGRKSSDSDSQSAETDRTARAARVVERALVGSGNTAKNGDGQTSALSVKFRDDEGNDLLEHPATHSKMPNLFNITRFWRGRRDEEDAAAQTGDTNRTGNDRGADVSGVVGDKASGADHKAEKTVHKTPRGDADDISHGNASRIKQDADRSDEMIESDAAKSPLKPSSTMPRLVPVFVLPPLTLLNAAPIAVSKRSQTELTDNVAIIERTLEQFNIGANVVEVASGPSVTRYEIQLAPGIKVSKIVSLADNLAMSLAAIDVRVEAPIPGKAAIGVEVPNATPVTVSLRECLDTPEFKNAPSKLTVALGKDVSGQFKYADLTKMPHLLIGGSTNSGKSVCLNVLIASLVYRATPQEVRLLMIDPKRVELSLWDGIPHLMHPVVKDVKQAAGIFRAALKEMDRRYDIFAQLGTRNIEGYNQRVTEPERMPYIVLIVDELADLMMQQGPEIETSICRLAQLARATGIHLIIATQRPSVDIITGTIKANISSRIAFAVASQVDSRTILDMTGADRLIGRGDMLFMPIDAAKPLRVQGCYLSEGETNALVDYLKLQDKPDFTLAVAETGGSDSTRAGGISSDEDEDDEFFEQAVRLVVNNGQASTSMLQRRFRIGYTRAARIVEMMEEKGIVGALNGAKPRELLISKDEVEQMFNPGGAIPSVESYKEEA